MKTKIVKTAFATACVVAAGMGCFKAYTAPSQSESSMLLAENVEALSKEDGDKGDDFSVCSGPSIYWKTGTFYGNSSARFHIADGIDIVYKNVTWTECYAEGPNQGDKSGFNGYAEIHFGESSYESCEGSHYSPIY